MMNLKMTFRFNMPTYSKRHRLTDGTYITVNELAEQVSLSLSAARRRLSLSKKREELFSKRFLRLNLESKRGKVEKAKDKEVKKAKTATELAYEKHIVKTRSAYDPQWAHLMKNISYEKHLK